MEENFLALVSLCGLFAHAASLSVLSPHMFPKSFHPSSNYKRSNWQNSIVYGPPELMKQSSVGGKGPNVSPMFLPESLDELRQWWSNVAAQQKVLGYVDPSRVADLEGVIEGPNVNVEDDFSDSPQDYNYFYGLEPFPDTLSSDEAFRQALKAYILPGNPFLIPGQESDDKEEITGRNVLQGYVASDEERRKLPNFPLSSHSQQTANMLMDNGSQKKNLRAHLPILASTGSSSLLLPPTEATSQTPVSAAPAVFPSSSTPVSKTKGQKEFAMLRPPSDNVRKFDQWAKSAQDFMKSVASAAVRETRDIKPEVPSTKSEDLSQQLNSLKKRNKRLKTNKLRGTSTRKH